MKFEHSSEIAKSSIYFQRNKEKMRIMFERIYFKDMKKDVRTFDLTYEEIKELIPELILWSGYVKEFVSIEPTPLKFETTLFEQQVMSKGLELLEATNKEKLQIFSPNRNGVVVCKRNMLMYFLRKHCNCSLEKIGFILYRDHSTVTHSISEVELYRNYDTFPIRRQLAIKAISEMQQFVNELEKKAV